VWRRQTDKFLTDMFNNIEVEEWNGIWNMSYTCTCVSLIYNERNKTLYSKCCGKSILTLITALFSRVIEGKIEHLIVDKLMYEQNGFRAGQS
jgi:hypothetical protein